MTDHLTIYVRDRKTELLDQIDEIRTKIEGLEADLVPLEVRLSELERIMSAQLSALPSVETLQAAPAPKPERTKRGEIEAAIIAAFALHHRPDGYSLDALIANLAAYKPASVTAKLREMVKHSRLDLVDGRYRLHVAEPKPSAAEKTVRAAVEGGLIAGPSGLPPVDGPQDIPGFLKREPVKTQAEGG
jgi:hypothetical protein